MVKNPPANAEDTRNMGSISGSGRSPRGGNGSSLQYSCLENSMHRGIWKATVQGTQRVRHDWMADTHAFFFYIWIFYFGYHNGNMRPLNVTHSYLEVGVVHICKVLCPYNFVLLSNRMEFFFSFFSFIFISWRLITLQYCSGFCHTLTWISHGVTCIPHPDAPSHLPPHPILLGFPSAPDPSTCLMHPTWAGDLFHYR